MNTKSETPAATPHQLDMLRHSCAHIMAHAVTSLYPDARVTIGPSTEDGFYYDFERPTPFTEEDLARIEDRMRELVKADQSFQREEKPREEAIRFYEKLGEPFKVEILKEIQDPVVSFYREGNFVDLCRGPHMPSTGKVEHFRLLSVAGAYWRGDEHRPMLQRIYGTAFFTQEELEAHLARLEEAKKRDHRKLGRALDLFSVQEAAGPGLIFWHPKGAMVRAVIEQYLRTTLTANGYQFVITPHIARVGLWQTSGHWDFYRENMFTPMDLEGQLYIVKPMNCPGHILIYQSTRRSYRELPFRLAEFGTVYRYERAGVMHGLMRVRGFTQDDAHIFCQPEQLAEELAGCLALVLEILRTFGFQSFDVFISTKPAHAVGSDEMWVKAETALRDAVIRAGLSPQVDPGAGVFYGPKIDVTIRDSINRSWQCATIQVDFNNPARFGIEYTGSDGKAHEPIMIHRALLGSFERFLGVLIEHYAGAFPAWLAPVQVIVAPVADGQVPYAREVASAARAKGLRVEVNEDNQPLGAKIRAAQMTKAPCVWVVGKREQEARSVSVRRRDVAEQRVLPFESAIESLAEEVSRRG